MRAGGVASEARILAACAGTYQVVVNTLFPFSDGQASCDFINFQLTGPGVSYSTQLGQGDADQEVTTQNFAASSSYTASDNTVAPGTSLRSARPQRR